MRFAWCAQELAAHLMMVPVRASALRLVAWAHHASNESGCCAQNLR